MLRSPQTSLVKQREMFKEFRSPFSTIFYRVSVIHHCTDLAKEAAGEHHSARDKDPGKSQIPHFGRGKLSTSAPFCELQMALELLQTHRGCISTIVPRPAPKHT